MVDHTCEQKIFIYELVHKYRTFSDFSDEKIYKRKNMEFNYLPWYIVLNFTEAVGCEVLTCLMKAFNFSYQNKHNTYTYLCQTYIIM